MTNPLASLYGRIADAGSALLGRGSGPSSSASPSSSRRGPSNRTPPRYNAYGGSWLDGRGYGPPGRTRDYDRDLGGRLDWNGIVRLCLRWYGDAVSRASFKVGRKLKKGERKGEWDENASHPLAQLFNRRPCPVFSWKETLTKIISGYLIDGNAYLVIVRSGAGYPVELWWVPNRQVTVVAGQDGNPRAPIAYYEVDGGINGKALYAPSDVVHIRDIPDEENPLVGMGALKSFLSDLVGYQRASEYTESVLRKSNAGIILMPPKGDGGMSYEMTSVEEDAMLAHRGRLERGLGRGSESNVIALTSYLEHAKIGFSPEEVTLDRITDALESRIVAAMGLSPLLLDLPSSRDSKTYANKGEARKAAWEDSVVPLLAAISEAFRDQVLYGVDEGDGMGSGSGRPMAGQYGDPIGLEVWADTSEVPALQGNAQELADYWTGLVDSGLCTREYAANQLDIPPEAIPEEEAEDEEEQEVEAGDGDTDSDAAIPEDEDESGDDDQPDDESDDDPPATKAEPGEGDDDRQLDGA